MTLGDMAANGDVVAKSHFNDVTQYKFIAITHMLMDILPFTGRLSKVFQGDRLDFNKVAPMTDSTNESLKDMLRVWRCFRGQDDHIRAEIWRGLKTSVQTPYIGVID